MTRKIAFLYIVLFVANRFFSQQSTALKQVSIFTVEATQLNFINKI